MANRVPEAPGEVAGFLLQNVAGRGPRVPEIRNLSTPSRTISLWPPRSSAPRGAGLSIEDLVIGKERRDKAVIRGQLRAVEEIAGFEMGKDKGQISGTIVVAGN